MNIPAQAWEVIMILSSLVAVALLIVAIKYLTPAVITLIEPQYGSVEFDLHAEGIKCYDSSTSRVELDYTLLSGSNDYNNGYLTLKADEGMVDGISCTAVDNDFIVVQLSSPTRNFMLAGFEDYGPLMEDDSLTLEFHVSMVGGKTWVNATTKSIAVSCDIDKCDTHRGDGNCDFYSAVNFYHNTLETCS